MPYISRDSRYVLDGTIGLLAKEIKEFVGPAIPGALNYAMTKLILSVYNETKNYNTYNTIIGVLESCKLEMYRKQVAEYEDIKIKENGAV